MKNVFKQLPKSVSTTQGLSTAVTTANFGILRKILRWEMQTFIISNKKYMIS